MLEKHAKGGAVICGYLPEPKGVAGEYESVYPLD